MTENIEKIIKILRKNDRKVVKKTRGSGVRGVSRRRISFRRIYEYWKGREKEELWFVLNQRIGARHPNTKEELVRYAREAWDSIPQAQIDTLCASFRAKLVACKSRGGAC